MCCVHHEKDTDDPPIDQVSISMPTQFLYWVESTNLTQYASLKSGKRQVRACRFLAEILSHYLFGTLRTDMLRDHRDTRSLKIGHMINKIGWSWSIIAWNTYPVGREGEHLRFESQHRSGIHKSICTVRTDSCVEAAHPWRKSESSPHSPR